MNDIENVLRYMRQKTAEIDVSFLFRDFGSRFEDFNKHLDLLLRYGEPIPKGSAFYRARTVGSQTYCDLTVVEDGRGYSRSEFEVMQR